MRSRWWRYAYGGVAAAGLVTLITTTENQRILRLLPEDNYSVFKRVSKQFSTWTDHLSIDSSSSCPNNVLAASPILPKQSDGDGSGDVESAPLQKWASVQKWDDNWDLRDPKFLGMAEYPKATRHLILIRHGQYNLESDDDAERKLTELGRKQLRLTGSRLKDLSCQNDVKYDKIFVSTMTRALESADIIAEAMPDVPRELPGDALLREGAPYPPEPPNWSVAKSKEQTAKKLLNYYVDGPRIESAFRKYFRRASYEQKEDSTEIIVCHANVIRYFAMRALQLPPEAWLRISLKNGSITLISITPRGKVALRALGDAGHMPPDCLTTT